tara:strand:- start:505 stop:1287 length:783 start_codon:yes stop_codon:yes gene_type:complete
VQRLSIKDLSSGFGTLLKNKKIENLMIANNMGKFGLIEKKNKNQTNEEVLSQIKHFLPNASIIVPTANLNLPNSEMTYDNKNTPSYKMGSFSEFIRKKNESMRSFHPFWSLSVLGKNSNNLTSDISNHAYDKNSVFFRLFQNKKNYFLSLGQHPRFMLSIIHHIEHINKVPYRFEKSFSILCRKNEKSDFKKKEFKLDVLKDEYRYKERTCNKFIFSNFENKGDLKFIKINNLNLYLFNIVEFYEITCALFKKDIFCYWK